MSTIVASHPGIGFTYYARWIGRCKHCKGLVKIEQTAAEVQPGWHIGHQRLVHCPHGCTSRTGTPLYVPVKMVTGTHSDRTCSVTCRGAKGPSCDCSCAGANHGADS